MAAVIFVLFCFVLFFCFFRATPAAKPDSSLICDLHHKDIPFFEPFSQFLIAWPFKILAGQPVSIDMLFHDSPAEQFLTLTLDILVYAGNPHVAIIILLQMKTPPVLVFTGGCAIRPAAYVELCKGIP